MLGEFYGVITGAAIWLILIVVTKGFCVANRGIRRVRNLRIYETSLSIYEVFMDPWGLVLFLSVGAVMGGLFYEISN